MAPPTNRRTGIYGMSDLNKVSQKKRKTGVSGMGDLNKPTQKKRNTGVFGMGDLKKNTGVADGKERTAPRRLRDLVASELPADNGLMDDLTVDHTLGVLDDKDSESEASDEDSDEEDGDSVSEAEEVGSSEEETEDGSSVDEDTVKKAVQEDSRRNREEALFRHDRRLERVEADNQFVAKMNDEELNSHVLPDPKGGYFELVPVSEGEKIPASELVQLHEAKGGVLFDPSKMEVYKTTKLTDPKTNKVLKTVRRHKNGPPNGLTCKASSISEKDAKVLLGGEANDL